MELAKGSKGTGGELPLFTPICVHDEQHTVILGIVLAPILCVDDVPPVRLSPSPMGERTMGGC
jgi:hypothetical protein